MSKILQDSADRWVHIMLLGPTTLAKREGRIENADDTGILLKGVKNESVYVPYTGIQQVIFTGQPIKK